MYEEVFETLLASMGPRFFKRGELTHRPEAVETGGASMGPRFFKRGETLPGLPGGD